MPYIKQEYRERIDDVIDNLPLSNPGEVNYAITRMILGFIQDRKDKQGGKVKYQDINDIMGAIEGAKLEFYRRFAAVYEDGKKEENGDVF